MSEEVTDRKQQCVAQHLAVVDMLLKIANVYAQVAVSMPDVLVEMRGKESARVMEYLGNLMNNMDIVTAEDAHWDPIFRAAHELWPEESDIRVKPVGGGDG